MTLKQTPLQTEIKQARPFRSPAEEAAVGLILTTDLLRRRIARQLEPYGITQQQYNVLRILRGAHPDPLPTLEIAERMIEEAPGITRLIDRLEAKRLVLRKRCETDRRQVHCSITLSGLDLLATLDAPTLAEIEAAFRGLGKDRVEQLSALLDELRAGMRRRPDR